MYKVKEKVDQSDWQEEVTKLENWIITGNTEGSWFYKGNKNNNEQTTTN